jgi:hypothetical protein
MEATEGTEAEGTDSLTTAVVQCLRAVAVTVGTADLRPEAAFPCFKVRI